MSGVMSGVMSIYEYFYVSSMSHLTSQPWLDILSGGIGNILYSFCVLWSIVKIKVSSARLIKNIYPCQVPASSSYHHHTLSTLCLHFFLDVINVVKCFLIISHWLFGHYQYPANFLDSDIAVLIIYRGRDKLWKLFQTSVFNIELVKPQPGNSM